jgi:hypothetical protein
LGNSVHELGRSLILEGLAHLRLWTKYMSFALFFSMLIVYCKGLASGGALSLHPLFRSLQERIIIEE